MVKLIPISENRRTIVDDDDFDFLNQFKWSISEKSCMYYPVAYYKGKQLIMHRVIMNAPRNMVVDHINGNTLDNRKSNLRIVTPHQNHRNQHVPKTSKYRGVYRNKNRWIVNIMCNHKTVIRKAFEDEEEAGVIANSIYRLIDTGVINGK